MLAALVIFGAVACTENQEENIPEAKKEPVLSFVANIDVDETRTDLKEVGDEWTTVWSGDDILNVYNHEVSDVTFTFVNSVAEPNVFICTDERVLDLIGWPVQIDNSDNFNSTTGKKGGSLYADVEYFQPNANISLTVNSSFFRFSSYFDVDVTLELSSPGVETYQPFVKDDGTRSNTITLPAGDDVWVAFQTYSNCTLTATINGQVIKSKEGINFVDQMIYNLGEIGEKVPNETYGIVGGFNSWNEKSPVDMYLIPGTNVYVRYDVDITPESGHTEGFKFVKNKAWTNAKGSSAVKSGNWTVGNSNGDNITYSTNNVDIYFDASNGTYCILAAGSDMPTPAKNVLYLIPGKWDNGWARFAAYFFQDGKAETWKNMTSVGEGRYVVIAPDGYGNVIFCRMNKSATANNWSNKWQQTNDLTVPASTSIVYDTKATKEDADKPGGSWGTYAL